MKSLRNSVHLLGRLGKDPDVKMFNGNKRAAFSMATNDWYKNQKGEKVDDTQWHYVVIWGTLADVAEKYLKKGQEVLIQGRITYRDFEDEGVKRSITEIVVNDLVMVGKSPQEDPSN